MRVLYPGAEELARSLCVDQASVLALLHLVLGS